LPRRVATAEKRSEFGSASAGHQEAGREFHHDHARLLARSDAAATAATWLSVALLRTGAVLVLYFVIRR